MDRRGSKNKVAVYHLGVQILVTPTASSRVLARRALHGALIRPAAAAQLVWRKFEVKTRIEFVARENKSDQPQAFALLFSLTNIVLPTVPICLSVTPQRSPTTAFSNTVLV